MRKLNIWEEKWDEEEEEEETMEETEEVEEMEEEPVSYTLRRLVDRDLFPVLDILGRILPDELATIFVQVATKKKVEEVGMVVMMRLIKAICQNIGKVDEELYALLSDVSGIPADELAEMPFGTTPMMLLDIVKNEKNVGFFKVLSKLF